MENLTPGCGEDELGHALGRRSAVRAPFGDHAMRTSLIHGVRLVGRTDNSSEESWELAPLMALTSVATALACGPRERADLAFTAKNRTSVESRNVNGPFEALRTCAGVRRFRSHDHEKGLGNSSVLMAMDMRLVSQRPAFDRARGALRGDGREPDGDDGAAGVPVSRPARLRAVRNQAGPTVTESL
jgi:hypothetical protein